MIRVRIRGSFKDIVDVVSDLQGKTLAELYILVGSPNELLDIINRSVSRGIVVEIIPDKPVEQEATSPNEKRPAPESKPTKSELTSETTVPQEDDNLLKKYKKKNATEKSQSSEEEQAKKEESKVPPPKAEVLKADNVKVATEKVGEEPQKGDKKSENVASVQVSAQVEEEGNELSFDEWIRFKDEAFKRKIVK